MSSVIAITTKPLPRDNPDAVLDLVGEGWLRHTSEGALAYDHSDFERVKQCYRKLGDQAAAKLRYCPMAIAAAIGTWDDPLFFEIETWCKDLIKADMGADVTVLAEYALAAAYGNAFVPNLVPGWFKTETSPCCPSRCGRRPSACRQDTFSI